VLSDEIKYAFWRGQPGFFNLFQGIGGKTGGVGAQLQRSLLPKWMRFEKKNPWRQTRRQWEDQD
jgi:hypothetical protein